MEIVAVDCEIEGCGWECILLPALSLDTDGVDQSYGYFYQHLVEDHELNPDTHEVPGLTKASCRLILTAGLGSLVIKMEAKKEFRSGQDLSN